MTVTAAILAGGQGSRMGGQDKGLLLYQGAPLIRHVLQRIVTQVDQIVINANRNIHQYQSFGYPVIQDHNPHFLGPLAGIQAVFDQLQTEWLMVVPCDTPRLPEDLVYRLQQATVQHRALLAVAQSGTQIHPVCCLCHRQLAPSLNLFLQEEQRRVRDWQALHAPVYVDFGDTQAFVNLNSPEQLVKAETR